MISFTQKNQPPVSANNNWEYLARLAAAVGVREQYFAAVGGQDVFFGDSLQKIEIF